MELMGCRVHTPTRAHTPRGGTRARLGRVRVCQSAPPGAARAGRKGNGRAGVFFFFQRTPRASAPRSQPALIGEGGSFPVFICYSPLGGSRSRWNIPGWGVLQHTLLLYRTPHNPTAGVNVGSNRKGQLTNPGESRCKRGCFGASSPHTMCPFPSFAARMLGIGSQIVPCLRLSADGCASHCPPYSKPTPK